MMTRRNLLGAAVLAGSLRAQKRVFDVRSYGAIGDGRTLETAAIQKTIDTAAAAGGGQVLIPGGRKFLVSTLVLKGGIDFHLADDAQLLVSTRESDYPAGSDGVLTANGATGLTISGTGRIEGRAEQFMTRYLKEGEIWVPGKFRPKIFVLAGCKDLEVREITFAQAPQWGLHMLGCERVLVDGLKIRNNLEVPNCDGIDPDHCRDVEIRNCDIECGDDAIVVKTTRQTVDYGPSARIHVHDCVMATKDSGLKIGTETTADVFGIRFEKCRIKSCCRGLTIQLRDEGNVFDIDFSDIEFTSQYQAAPWWGRGEAISFTAIPRAQGTKLGRIQGVRLRNITVRAENSVRINGSGESRIGNVTIEGLKLTMDRWTSYPGPVFDNRPTSAYPDIEEHATPAISVRDADGVTVRDSAVEWGSKRPDYFTHALEAERVTNLALTRFTGEAAHPARDAAVLVR
ncbi:MAG TPA: glycosyl hydrolase family 28 protein [Bryobacteraceae bacterium]|nr:glycosyl hydrolase family 28 protein [Bryobacteraceae bacterium]